MCDQQRLRPACAYAQTDQSLCLSLEYSINVKLLTEHHLEFLSLKGGCKAAQPRLSLHLSNATLLKIACHGSVMYSAYSAHCTCSLLFQNSLPSSENSVNPDQLASSEVTPVRLEPTALRSRVKESTTEPLCSLNLHELCIYIVNIPYHMTSRLGVIECHAIKSFNH